MFNHCRRKSKVFDSMINRVEKFYYEYRRTLRQTTKVLADRIYADMTKDKKYFWLNDGEY